MTNTSSLSAEGEDLPESFNTQTTSIDPGLDLVEHDIDTCLRDGITSPYTLAVLCGLVRYINTSVSATLQEEKALNSSVYRFRSRAHITEIVSAYHESGDDIDDLIKNAYPLPQQANPFIHDIYGIDRTRISTLSSELRAGLAIVSAINVIARQMNFEWNLGRRRYAQERGFEISTRIALSQTVIDQGTMVDAYVFRGSSLRSLIHDLNNLWVPSDAAIDHNIYDPHFVNTRIFPIRTSSYEE
jgi:hypothetical protein